MAANINSKPRIASDKATFGIVIEKTSSAWYEVTCPDGKHGYMSSEYLTYARTEQQSTTTNVGFRNDVVEARQLRDQPFRIYRVVPELDKVTVYARHIFYDLLDNMIKSVKPASDAVGASVVQSISDGCLSEHDLIFYSDLESTASDVSFENINPVEALLGENGLTSKYEAELVRDSFDVFLVSRVGTDSEVQIREKKNLTGISIDVDMTDAVTRIMPTGEDADGNVLYLPELYIDSPNIGAFPHPKWIHLPVSEAKEVAEGDNYKSLTSCYQDMRNAAQAEFDAGCDMPTVTLKVDFVNCKDTEEYKQFAALSDIFLGDAVRVVRQASGLRGDHAHDAVHLRLPDPQVHQRHAGNGDRNAGGYDHFRPSAGFRVDQRHEADAQLYRFRASAKWLCRQSAGEGCGDPERTHPDSSHHAGTHCAGADRNAERQCDHGGFCKDSGIGCRDRSRRTSFTLPLQ